MSRPPLHPEIARDALLYGALALLPVPILDSVLQRMLLDRLDGADGVEHIEM